jgi:protoporphyrinogen oxidase
LSDDSRDPIIIVGAGPTGLGAAHALHRAGHTDWVLYERSDRVGGLSRSFRDARGFTWDLGGHVVFSHYDRFSELLDAVIPPEGWVRHERETWVRAVSRWVPYPFQSNIRHLPPDARERCLMGLRQAADRRSAGPFASLADFIDRTFGEGIAGVFMRPYNRKVWACDPEEMAADWIAGRVAVPDVERVARNARKGIDDVSWGPNSRFRFPRRGGTGAIWEALAALLPPERIRLNSPVVAIDSRARAVRLEDGRPQRYGTLVSTVPLPELASLAGRADWRELAAGLRHTAVHVIGLGLRGRPPAALEGKCWMYFPEPEAPFYRVTHFSHYSPENVDDITRHWSLMAEVSESVTEPLDAGQVVEATVAAAAREGLIEGTERVTHTWHCRAEYAYPVPTLGRDAILRELQPRLEEAGILSRGRFGAWLYEIGNMDHSYMQGAEAAERLLFGSPETTLPAASG